MGQTDLFRIINLFSHKREVRILENIERNYKFMLQTSCHKDKEAVDGLVSSNCKWWSSTVPNWIVYIIYIALFLHGHFKCLLI